MPCKKVTGSKIWVVSVKCIRDCHIYGSIHADVLVFCGPFCVKGAAGLSDLIKVGFGIDLHCTWCVIMSHSTSGVWCMVCGVWCVVCSVRGSSSLRMRTTASAGGVTACAAPRCKGPLHLVLTAAAQTHTRVTSYSPETNINHVNTIDL